MRVPADVPRALASSARWSIGDIHFSYPSAADMVSPRDRSAPPCVGGGLGLIYLRARRRDPVGDVATVALVAVLAPPTMQPVRNKH